MCHFIARRTPAFGALERCVAGVSAIKKNETQRHKAIASSYGHFGHEAAESPSAAALGLSRLCEPDHTVPACSRTTLSSARDRSRFGGRVVMGNGYLRAAPEKNPGPPTRQSAVCGEDVIYVSMCSGGVIIKISAADRPKFVLGQLIIFGAVVVVALVELTLWLVN